MPSPSPFSRRGLYRERFRRPAAGSERRDPSGFVMAVFGRAGRILRRLAGWIFQSAQRYVVWLRMAGSPRDLFTKMMKSLLILGGIGGLFVIIFVGYVLLTLPDVDEVGALFAAESTVITDRNGVELYRIHGDEDRTLVPLARMSDSIEQATIAIEDQRFYERGCFDPRAFSRAVLRNLLGGFGSQGGSTITQQFAKNALIGSRKKKITRKLREYILSCQLENRYTKDEILELYLNRIPYGNNAHGVEQAAKTYFAKSASDLTLAESSILAALPQLPAYLSPYGDHVRTTLSTEGQARFTKGNLRTSDDVRDDDFWIGIVGECFTKEDKEDKEINEIKETKDSKEPDKHDQPTFAPSSLRSEGATVGKLDKSTQPPAKSPADTCHGVYIGGRTDQVLQNMQDQGFITEEQKVAALWELQGISFKRSRENIRAPHFVLWVREWISQTFRDKFDPGYLESGGLSVKTTLDYSLQTIAEDVVSEVGAVNADLYGADNAALLAADPATGQILAYVGNRDYWNEETDGNVDIIRAPRQPGSSFKPFVYAAAFMNGASPATVLYDVPTQIGEDQPENYDRIFWGPLTIRRALGASRNIPAAKAFFLAGGEDAVVNLTADMGVPAVRDRRSELTASRGQPYSYGWPLALGAAEVPLLEMVQGYTTFARGGKAIPLFPVLSIADRSGNILYEAPQNPQERDVLDPRAAFMITSILSDESVRPEGFWREQLTIPGEQTAAKTGTSNKCLKRAPVAETADTEGSCLDSKPSDNWTIGFTPSLIAGAWVGNASGGTLFAKADGLTTASPIWRRFMIAAHAKLNLPKTIFAVPEELATAQISELSGKLASPCTPLERRRAEFFFAEQEPKEFDSACTEIEVDKLTGLLASDECPAEARNAGAFFAPRSELPDRFPLWEAAVQKWAKDLSRSPVHSRAVLADLVEPINLQEEKDSVFWKMLGVDASGVPIRIFRGTGAFLPLPLPLAPTEECTIALTPGRLIKPTLSIVSPSQNGTATAPAFRPQIRYTVGQAVREIRYEIDKRVVAVTTAETHNEPMIRLTRRFDTAGLHTLTVTLTDSYFNTVSDSVRFSFRGDEGVPQVRILSPVPGAAFRAGSPVTVRAEATDPGGAVDRVQFFFGDRLLTTRRGASPFELTFTLDGTAVGPAVIRVIAVDGAKNEGVDEVEIYVSH